MMRSLIILVLAGWLLVSGCGTARPAEPGNSGAAGSEQPEPASPAVVDFGALEPEDEPGGIQDGDNEGEDGMEAPAPGVRHPGERAIKAAQQALAARLSVSVDAITVEGVEEVDWPDSSLGCPDPEMMYLQVVTPGYRIVLSVEGTEYTVHSDRDEQVILCGEDGAPLE